MLGAGKKMTISLLVMKFLGIVLFIAMEVHTLTFFSINGVVLTDASAASDLLNVNNANNKFAYNR